MAQAQCHLRLRCINLTLLFASSPGCFWLVQDDFGWADADWHHPSSGSTDPLATPNMTALIANGIELDQHCKCGTSLNHRAIVKRPSDTAPVFLRCVQMHTNSVPPHVVLYNLAGTVSVASNSRC